MIREVADGGIHPLAAVEAVEAEIDGHQRGDPRKAAREMIRLVEQGSAALRIPMGRVAIDRMRVKLGKSVFICAICDICGKRS